MVSGVSGVNVRSRCENGYDMRSNHVKIDCNILYPLQIVLVAETLPETRVHVTSAIVYIYTLGATALHQPTTKVIVRPLWPTGQPDLPFRKPLLKEERAGFSALIEHVYLGDHVPGVDIATGES